MREHEYDEALPGFAKGRGIVWLTCAVVVGSLWLTYGKVLPFPNGDLGHDYSLFIPNLVVGLIKFKVNGLFSLPWFSPAQCGGFPFFPDANAPYFSLPQFLTLLVDPVIALQITFIVFGAIGFLGGYLLLRNGFSCSQGASLLGAFIFALNGFYAHRFVNGHLAFHAFALAPWAAWAVFHGLERGWRAHVLTTCVLGGLFAAMLHAGMVHGIPPIILGIVILLLVRGILGHWGHAPWVRLAVGGILGICLSAIKLVPLMALLKQFPRDQYALPGFDSIPNAVWLTAQTLFVYPPMAEIHAHLANGSILLQAHEFQYGIGVVPALVLFIFLVRQAWKQEDKTSMRTILAIWAVGLLMTIPILLNYYTPWWNGIIKSLPYFKNSSSLVRWFALYVFVLPVMAAIMLDFLELPKKRFLFVCGLGMLITWVQAVNSNLEYMSTVLARYHPGHQVDYWRKVKYGEEKPNINFMTLSFDIRTMEPITPIDRNDAMTHSASQIMCYQSMMGYGLESFPIAPLGPKAAMSVVGERFLNIKRPECYLYPEENGCKPGDHFPVDDERTAKNFLFYKDYEFSKPKIHEGAVVVNALALLLTVGAVAHALWGRRSRDQDGIDLTRIP
ncbi:MAG: hypothetical protein HQL89_04730 [Magnetococcales bacterium]|nr:hypothetical protein [Magnetococcales bacterium]